MFQIVPDPKRPLVFALYKDILKIHYFRSCKYLLQFHPIQLFINISFFCKTLRLFRKYLPYLLGTFWLEILQLLFLSRFIILDRLSNIQLILLFAKSYFRSVNQLYFTQLFLNNIRFWSFSHLIFIQQPTLQPLVFGLLIFLLLLLLFGLLFIDLNELFVIFPPCFQYSHLILYGRFDPFIFSLFPTLYQIIVIFLFIKLLYQILIPLLSKIVNLIFIIFELNLPTFTFIFIPQNIKLLLFNNIVPLKQEILRQLF